MSSCVIFGRKTLKRLPPHQLQPHVDHALMGRQQGGIAQGDAISKYGDRSVQLSGGMRFHDEPQGGGVAPSQHIAGQQKAFRPLGPHQIEPHMIGGRPERSGCGKADAGVIGGNDHVAVERDVRADRQTVPLHLGDDRFVHSKDVETEIGPIAGMPDVILEGSPPAVVRGIVRAPSVRARFDALGDVRA
ncbi:hypothetical protein D3C73_971360 [compost metagenome]